MIKYSDITVINVDDYLREQKRIGRKILVWDKKKWCILNKFVEAATSPITEYGMPYGKGWTLRDGEAFFGMQHTVFLGNETRRE